MLTDLCIARPPARQIEALMLARVIRVMLSSRCRSEAGDARCEVSNAQRYVGAAERYCSQHATAPHAHTSGCRLTAPRRSSSESFRPVVATQKLRQNRRPSPVHRAHHTSPGGCALRVIRPFFHIAHRHAECYRRFSLFFFIATPPRQATRRLAAGFLRAVRAASPMFQFT